MSDSIAARLGDHHLCSQHVGGDALPACAPTILIGSQPAARVGDRMQCEGPIDTIQLGEPTVLLSGKQAARYGDATAHFGLIDDGHPTVIIGKMTASAKRMRLMERLRLIDAARKKADDLSGEDRERLLDAADRLARNNQSVEHMRLAHDVYNTSDAPEGFRRVTGDDLPPELRNATFESGTGFYAALYQSEIDGHYVLTFRGTEMTTWQDWVMGNSQNIGLPAPQYAQAISLAQQVHAVYGDNLHITGHSLGGGLAGAASLATGVPADTFNAAGVHTNTYLGYGLDPGRADDLINAYRVEGEILTTAQDWLPLPDAAGNVIGLPAVNPDGSPRSNPATEAPRGWRGWANAILNPIGEIAGRTTDQIGEAVERHNGRVVIDGLEAQKSADIRTIEGML
ncbi:MAG: PAAR domain-containing protein [Polyangiaceae bacterium]|nr:PAAR domain-containing protein [Polyangiaceae bacterium]